MKRVSLGLGWLIALTCNCGPLTQAAQSARTAQAVVTRAQRLCI